MLVNASLILCDAILFNTKIKLFLKEMKSWFEKTFWEN